MSKIKEDRIRFQVLNAKKEIKELNDRKSILNNEITLQEDILRKARQECQHPQELVENTHMVHFKKCTICEDLLFRP